MFRGIEIIRGHGIGRKSIWFRAVFGKLLQGVAVLRVKGFVFQIMGNACGGVQPLPVQTEPCIHAAVTGGEKCVFLRKPRTRYNTNL